MERLIIFLFILGFVYSAAGDGAYGNIKLSSKGDSTTSYEDLEDEWSFSEEIDMSEKWGGDLSWSGSHKLFSIRLDTTKLIEQGKLREDCEDIRLSWRGNLVPSRVQAGSCDNQNTWIYFSNIRYSNGEYLFAPEKKVDEVNIHYGNTYPGKRHQKISPSNNNQATYVHPEGPIEAYYGTHESTTYVNEDTHLEGDGQNSDGYQTWSVDFQSSQYGDQTPDFISISDDDGNRATVNNPTDTYTVYGTDYAWIEPGDDITVYFEVYDVESSEVTKAWPYQPPQINDNTASPAISTGTSPVADSSTNLQVDIDEPEGDDVTATFYDVSDGSQIGQDMVYGGSGTAQVSWNNLNQGQTYEWRVEACSSSCVSSTYEFNVEEIGLNSPSPADSTGTSPTDTGSPSLEIDVNEPNNDPVTVSFYDADTNTEIAEDTVNSGDGTASVTWNGLNEAETYNWYVDACSFSCKQSSTYQFQVNGFPEIESIDFTNSTNEHRFTAEARVTDANGDGDLNSCQVEATGSSGNSQIYNPGFTGVNGDNEAFCTVDITYDDDTNWDHLENIDVQFEVQDDENSDTSTQSNEFPNHAPVVDDITFDDYPAEHAFNVTSYISDVDSVNPEELDTCTYTFTDTDSNSVTENVPVDHSYGSNNQASCFYSSVNSSMPGFEPTEDIDVNLEIQDAHSSTDTLTETHTLPNRPPQITVVGPKNDESVLSVDADLHVKLSDPEGDTLTLAEFRDGDTNNVIDSVTNPPDDLIVQWEDLDVGDYTWEVEVSDSWDSYTESGIQFRRVLSANYRVEHAIDYEYSSLIVEDTGQGFFFFETSVETNDRTVTTYLQSENLTAEFVDTGSSQRTYEVTDDPKRFHVRVQGDDPGNHELSIVTEDDSVSSNTTVTFPVYIRESISEGSEVPGLTIPYLVLIFLVSSVLYFALL